MFEQDYIIRQIRDCAAFLAKVLFGKATALYEPSEEGVENPADQLHRRLLDLFNQGNINEAENLLFESVKENLDNPKYLEAALDFYSRCSKLGEETLCSMNFSPEEIQRGLTDITRLYQVPFDPELGT